MTEKSPPNPQKNPRYSQNLFSEVLEDSFISYAWVPENMSILTKGKFW